MSEKVVALYKLHRDSSPTGDFWTDIPEAEPRCRVRPKKTGSSITVKVVKGGAMSVDGEHELDVYKKTK